MTSNRNRISRKECRVELIRNVEVPVATNRSAGIAANVVVHSSSGSSRPAGPSAPAGSSKSYQLPSQLSVRDQLKQRELVLNAEIKPSKSVRDLTKVAQEYVNSQASQKLNILADRKVFNQLEPINVNDSVLDLNCAPMRIRKRSSFTRTDRDPEPVLADYLQPVEPLHEPDHLDSLDNLTSGYQIADCPSDPHSTNYGNICEILDSLNGVHY